MHRSLKFKEKLSILKLYSLLFDYDREYKTYRVTALSVCKQFQLVNVFILIMRQMLNDSKSKAYILMYACICEQEHTYVCARIEREMNAYMYRKCIIILQRQSRDKMCAHIGYLVVVVVRRFIYVVVIIVIRALCHCVCYEL